MDNKKAATESPQGALDFVDPARNNQAAPRAHEGASLSEEASFSFVSEMPDKTPTPSLSQSLNIRPASEDSIIRRAFNAVGVDESGGQRITGIGSILDNKYKIVHKIATGGMGVVFSAVHVKLGKQFAVKVISPGTLTNEEAHRRFVREAKASTLLSSPHTVRVFDYNITQWGEPYLVMEYISGQNLSDSITQHGSFEPLRAVRITKQITQSLMEAHETGLVHRDLKPSNVMLTQVKGHEDFVKIFDFGVVKFMTSPDDMDLTRQGSMLGTPRYMSPEQLETPEDVTQAADVYSLGLLLYFMLTGEKPFADISSNALVVQKLDKRTSIKIPKHIDVPKSVHTMFARMTSNDPSKRPEIDDVFYFLSDLEAEIQVGTWSGSRSIVLPQQRSAVGRVLPWLILLLLLLTGGIAWMLWSGDKPGAVKGQNTPQIGAQGPPPSRAKAAKAIAPQTDRKKPKTPEVRTRAIPQPAPRRAVVVRPKPRRAQPRRTAVKPRRTRKVWKQTVTVRTSPMRASVYLNGRLLGKSPVRFRKSRRATVRISVKKRGYFSKKITVGPNARRTISIRLKEIRIEMP